MNKYIKYTLICLFAALIIMQFFAGTPPENREENPDDLIVTEAISGEMATLLREACYDCHSMESKYPWYTSVAPVSWWIFDHIEEGRDELNFSDWASYSLKRKNHKLEEIAEEVMEDEMPLPSYKIAHPEGRLTDEEKQMIVAWSKEMRE